MKSDIEELEKKRADIAKTMCMNADAISQSIELCKKNNKTRVVRRSDMAQALESGVLHQNTRAKQSITEFRAFLDQCVKQSPDKWEEMIFGKESLMFQCDAISAKIASHAQRGTKLESEKISSINPQEIVATGEISAQVKRRLSEIDAKISENNEEYAKKCVIIHQIKQEIVKNDEQIKDYLQKLEIQYKQTGKLPLARSSAIVIRFLVTLLMQHENKFQQWSSRYAGWGNDDYTLMQDYPYHSYSIGFASPILPLVYHGSFENLLHHDVFTSNFKFYFTEKLPSIFVVSMSAAMSNTPYSEAVFLKAFGIQINKVMNSAVCDDERLQFLCGSPAEYVKLMM
jgi:hypothetical protein